MKKNKNILTTILLFATILIYSQERDIKKIKISGKIVEKLTNQALEYATISFRNTKNVKAVFGGITTANGEFAVDMNAGIYDVKVEFIGFKPLEIKGQKYFESANIGVIAVTENPNQLDDVVIRSEKSTMEIKLDKKVYNVGKDMVVKGGTASDVLQNVPSVAVDADGTVSLRGNESVRILIDGRPSNAINIGDALKAIPADALDKVEVITNPSSRYDAEGGGGILNIVLKKGKNNGLNGVVTATVGNPKNSSLTGSINFKSEKFNLFSNIGLLDNFAPGNSLTNSDFYTNGVYTKSVYERGKLERYRKGFNFNFGFDWYLSKSVTWTNTLSNRKNEGDSPQSVTINNVEVGKMFVQTRNNDQFSDTNEAEYSTNFIKKFKKEGQKLTIDGTFTRNFDNDASTITEKSTGSLNSISKEKVKNFQTQYRNLIQVDFVLPIKKNSQFETGYRGNFINLKSDYEVGIFDTANNYTTYPEFTNIFQYIENVNALYLQFGTKFNKISAQVGVRYENSDIDINLLTTNSFNKKNYENYFPSAFLTYQYTDKTSVSLNYSKRIERPRNRFIAPFSNYNSNVNIFQGNPDINPSFTDAFDFSVLTKFEKLTLTSSIYYNDSRSVFQFTRRESGRFVGTTPVLVSTPVNLDKETRYGLELNLNYTPYKWWRLNGNFNLFQSKISGDFSYTPSNATTKITTTIDQNAGSWFARITSKITLPYKIDWQSNVFYTASQNTAQGRSIGITVINMALSKDIFKDKATVALNVSDLLNSQKFIREFNLATVNSYTERQGRERQINLSLTYRFNKLKTDREKPSKREDMGGGDF